MRAGGVPACTRSTDAEGTPRGAKEDMMTWEEVAALGIIAVMVLTMVLVLWERKDRDGN